MKRKPFASLFAALLPALAVGGFLAACTHSPHQEPQPHCSIPATVRSFATPDSCRGFLLELNDSLRTRLRPGGPLWQAFAPRARNGQRVFIEYVAAADSGAVGCGGRLGRPVRLTCLGADSVNFPPLTGGGSPHHDTTIVVPPDTTRVPHDSTFTRRR